MVMGAYSALLGAAGHDKGRTVPPDPTQRVLSWGGAYPCLQLQANELGIGSRQCGGLMVPGLRCFRFEGRLWRRFKCNRCGRVATDWKVNDEPSVVA